MSQFKVGDIVSGNRTFKCGINITRATVTGVAGEFVRLNRLDGRLLPFVKKYFVTHQSNLKKVKESMLLMADAQ